MKNYLQAKTSGFSSAFILNYNSQSIVLFTTSFFLSNATIASETWLWRLDSLTYYSGMSILLWFCGLQDSMACWTCGDCILMMVLSICYTNPTIVASNSWILSLSLGSQYMALKNPWTTIKYRYENVYCLILFTTLSSPFTKSASFIYFLNIYCMTNYFYLNITTL